MTSTQSATRHERHALLAGLYRAAVAGAAPYPRTRDAVARWVTHEASARHLPATETLTQAHVFALGKAAPAMAAGAVDALRSAGWRIGGGIVVAASRPLDAAPESGGALSGLLDVRVGDHPVPDIGSLAAADAIARAVSVIEPGETAFVLLSGGATSLCAAPCPELVAAIGHPATAQQLLANLVQLLHERGLAIHEMNAIRRRLLRWGAGRLATAINARGAGAIPVFAISDVIGDDPAVIGSGPCTADPNGAIDTLALVDAHGLRSALHAELAVALGVQGGSAVAVMPPAASHAAFRLVHYEIVARNQDACLAVAHAARSAGVDRVLFYDVPLEGEAENLGHAIARGALKATTLSGQETVLIWGGEPTVTFGDTDNAGGGSEPDDDGLLPPTNEPPLGGRMQTLGLSAAMVLDSHDPSADGDPDRITILAAGTDGRDGPTDAAGAIVDAQTMRLAQLCGRDPVRDLRRSSSYRSLDAAGALLRTGHTGTNVMDIVVAHVAAAPAS